MLACSEIFWRPWNSDVWLEEILVPRDKYYVVHRRMVKKLRQRTGWCLAKSFGECTTTLSLNDTDRSRKLCMCNNNNVDSDADKMIGWPMGRREKRKDGREGLQWWRRAGKTEAWQPELKVIRESSAVYDWNSTCNIIVIVKHNIGLTN